MVGDQPRLIADSCGQTVMPSLVVIKRDKSILVGHYAQQEAKKYSDGNLLVASMKRSMGRHKEYGDHDSKMPVQVLTAIILAELKIRAETFLGVPVDKAVIAVPANFSFSQRQFTKEAALIAGLEPIRIVNEATASLCALRDQFDRRVVAADLGGGTFDVSAIECGGGVFEVKATSGDDQLCGDDFTSVVTQIILSKMAPQFAPGFIQRDPITSQRLIDAAEQAKRDLSSSESAEIKIPYVTTRDGGYETLNVSITRREFEDACEPLFGRLEKILSKVWSESGFLKQSTAPRPAARPSASVVTPPRKKRNWFSRMFSPKDKEPQIAQQPPPPIPQPEQHQTMTPCIWLIGNASRVPEIRRRLQSKYRAWHPPGILDLKEPVVLGAAKIGGILSGFAKDTLLLDVTPNTLSIETEGGVAKPIIARNTSIPTRRSETFTTVHDNQAAIVIRIFEGERPMSKDNKLLGTLRIEKIALARAGVPKIEVCFDVDASGLLVATGTDIATKNSCELRCNELVLSERQLNEYHLLVQKWTHQRRCSQEQ
jgi:molecular chaperone DnaK